MIEIDALNKLTTRKKPAHLKGVNDNTAHFRDSLGDVTTISAGYPLRGAADGLESGDVAIVQMRNVDVENGINWPEVQRIALPSTRPPTFLEAGDIIFTTRGTRNFALALNEIEGAAVCSPHFFVIRVLDANLITPAFLAWQINQRPAQHYFAREATGSHILNIRREVIENLPLAVPPLEQQRTIIALANAVHDERVALNKLVENRNHQMEAIALRLHHSDQNAIERPHA